MKNLHSITTLIVTTNHINNYNNSNNSNNDDHNDDKKSNSNDNLICLLIMNHCHTSLQFHFCEIFVSYNKAFRVSEYSTIPPFHHSIEWRRPVELLVSYFGPLLASQI